MRAPDLDLVPFASDDGNRSGNLIGLTDDGRRLLRGELQAELPEPPSPRSRRAATRPRQTTIPTDDADVPGDLCEILQRFRGELAKRESKPAYCFFTNATLVEIARRPPNNRGEFLDIPGLGAKRWDDFGTTLLDALSEWKSSGSRAVDA